jgi:hypothetical protein
MALDDNFSLVDQASWTQLAASGGVMVHSGDLTSAPDGASEFIDVNLADARRKPWRYLAPVVFRYSGAGFNQLPEALVGWMLRDETNADRKTFDIKTVVNVLELTAPEGAAQPFVYDLVANEIIYLDLYQRSGYMASVERHGEQASSVAQMVSLRAAYKASYADLIEVNVAARSGVLTERREDATITFGLDDDCTYNCLRPQTLLNEFL